MDKQKLLERCKYYKAEKFNPYESLETHKTMLWEYEKLWVEWTLAGNIGSNPLIGYLHEYINDGMELFEDSDQTPITLKALLYNRFNHWCPGPGFEHWYKTKYQKKVPQK
ncbi:MAG: hypothetical protein J6Q03_04155 [Paludibacteraceae bacterium]|nr:hypothetical protein [Paludibacteraceae bacterium]